jgi:hypothetical protein
MTGYEIECQNETYLREIKTRHGDVILYLAPETSIYFRLDTSQIVNE